MSFDPMNEPFPGRPTPEAKEAYENGRRDMRIMLEALINHEIAKENETPVNDTCSIFKVAGLVKANTIVKLAE